MASGRHVDLKAVRGELGVSQAEFADMIEVSIRTVQACEQGWRNPSPAVEKAALLLLQERRTGPNRVGSSCWDALKCSQEDRGGCLVHRLGQGRLCWMITGHVCRGTPLHSWWEKKHICFHCGFFHSLFDGGVPTR